MKRKRLNMNIVEIKGKAITTSVNAHCATKWYITAKTMIADYQRKGIFMKKIIRKRADERQNRGRNQSKHPKDEKYC